MRHCPFCLGAECRLFGTRYGAMFVRCVVCRSIYMRINEREFESRHEDGWADDEFVERISSELGTMPNVRVWGEVSRHFTASGPILEIGPGTGHLLAAARQAGHPVFGVETSAINRRFIADTWSIDTVYESLAQIPPHTTFKGVVLINVIEHIFSPDKFLHALRPLVDSGGTIFISTVNAGSLAARLYGTRWSMFKPLDHVSFPTATGFRRLADRCGYCVEHIWSSEYPMETIVSGLVAARDLVRDWRTANKAHGKATSRLQANHAANRSLTPTRRLVNLSRRLWFLDPSSPLISCCGFGGSIKAVYRIP